MTVPSFRRVAPVNEGLRLLGYRGYPDRVRLPRDNVVRATRRLRRLRRRLAGGEIGPDQVRASVTAWIGHARHADTWRLRERLLGQHVFTPRTTFDPPPPPATGRKLSAHTAALRGRGRVRTGPGR